MDKMELALGITAALMHVVAFVIYNRQMFIGSSEPKSATWTLWAFLTVLNSTSYLAMSQDWLKSLLPLCSSTACVITFGVALAKGKFKKPDWTDRTIQVLGICSCLIWWGFKTATIANLILQICVILSFIPTFSGVWKNPRIERAPPWFIWSSAYILSIVLVFLRWRHQPQDLAYPINGLVLHAMVGALTYRTAKNNGERRTV
ncbi:MAG: hypothetical protein ACYC44_04300 [Patescibacteria group bacterium]